MVFVGEKGLWHLKVTYFCDTRNVRDQICDVNRYENGILTRWAHLALNKYEIWYSWGFVNLNHCIYWNPASSLHYSLVIFGFINCENSRISSAVYLLCMTIGFKSMNTQQSLWYDQQQETRNKLLIYLKHLIAIV